MLNNKYKIKSNRESGYGRYDIMMIPKNKEDLGIVIEFKKADVKDVQNLDCLVNRALEQIEYRNYIQELIDGDIQKIMKLGIAFKGKEIMMKKEMIKKYRKMWEEILKRMHRRDIFYGVLEENSISIKGLKTGCIV